MTHAPTPTVLEIWTDGACKKNPGVGGWGAWLVWGKYTLELYGGSALTTNNQMELTAVIRALSAVKRPCPIIIHLDSSYVKDGITRWIHGWKKNGWRTADKKPVKNGELWQELDRLVSQHQIDWRWVKGHAGDPGNEKADALANLGVEAARGGIRSMHHLQSIVFSVQFFFSQRAVSSGVEHCLHTAGVTGSIPVPRTRFLQRA